KSQPDFVVLGFLRCLAQTSPSAFGVRENPPVFYKTCAFSPRFLFVLPFRIHSVIDESFRVAVLGRVDLNELFRYAKFKQYELKVLDLGHCAFREYCDRLTWLTIALFARVFSSCHV